MSGRDRLLLVDASVNLLLGAALVAFPEWLVIALGVPTAETAFYPSLLGGVLVGIGLALLLARSQRWRGLGGLGLGGAIAINLCGGIVLGVWLVVGRLGLPVRGRVFLWGLVVVLVGLSIMELAAWLRGRLREAR